ncbi:hypothetical protein E3U23_05370 [Erythrobacter litoralis]|uniref:hypothetical protein n=1 Tax=Erythrobacter litoralis TaxID=39960 RepID=UPI0024348488|nr:hypothetical protein [Erythrobacter litoralis]MDG6078621.1 hypothetical protein [Erythrobacter litoralis]
MNNSLRIAAACLSLIALSGQTTASAAEADFCARLAAGLGIDKPVSADGRTEWTTNSLNFGQRFLWGGSASTSLGIDPPENPTVADYERISEYCEATKKGAICRLQGPLTFRLGFKGSEYKTPLMPGEEAVVSVQGTKTMCKAGPIAEFVET